MHGNDKKLLDLLLLGEPLHRKIITGRSDLLLFQSSDRKNIITATFKANWCLAPQVALYTIWEIWIEFMLSNCTILSFEAARLNQLKAAFS